MTKHSVAILAGGKSSRMGTDKSFVRMLGEPLIARVLRAVQDLSTDIFVVTNRPDDYRALGLPLYGDVVLDAGSLGGLYSAVHYAAHPYVLCVACDMPFLNQALLKHLLAQAAPPTDVVVPRIAERPEPLHAVYGKGCLAPMRACIDAGRYKITGFFGVVQVAYVEEALCREYDPALRSFLNVNTPEEVLRVEAEAGD